MAALTPRVDRLGTRPIGRLLWESCTHTTLSVGVYGVYALTNAWFVARGVGPTALAAVNLVAPVLLLVGAVSTTVGVGAASLVSRALGGSDPQRAARAAGNAMGLFWVAALATTALGLAFLEPLLTGLGATDATRGYARDYAVIILAGAVVSTGFSSLVRAEGRMAFSTLLWGLPVAVQITLDPLLIWGLDMGVRGAAFGTVGGQAVSAVLSVWFFFAQRRRPYRIRAADLRPHGATLGSLISIGAPTLLAGAGATVLVLLVNRSLAAGAGAAAALAAIAVASRIQTFVTMPQTGISQGAQPVIGYNAGAGFAPRVRRALRLSLTATVVYGVAIGAVVAAAAPWLVGLFADEPAVVDVAVAALRILAVGFAVAGVTPLVSAYFQAIGRPSSSYVLSVGTLVAIKIPLVVAAGSGGPTDIWIALAAGEAAAALAALSVVAAHARRRTSCER
ncbi:MATE family efflux transporter [Demequina sp. NBRC 110055]|uniref:MATE family efflux transporter n=1 Tax=Demequina sp. NBRC 110055 TaxID=1570344 RepID=UPI000A01EE28|nr:MATE family efflux transporter [Demequina sp. NBRC 110055]